jgi:cell division protein FtsL
MAASSPPGAAGAPLPGGRLGPPSAEAAGGTLRAPQARRRPGLRLLTAENLAERSRRRRARAVGMLAVAVLVLTLLAVGGAQAIVAAQQVRLDTLQQQLAAAVSANQGLQLSHAELSSPERVLQMAEHQLGMVVPRTVTYLSAVSPPPRPSVTPAGAVAPLGQRQARAGQEPSQPRAARGQRQARAAHGDRGSGAGAPPPARRPAPGAADR